MKIMYWIMYNPSSIMVYKWMLPLHECNTNIFDCRLMLCCCKVDSNKVIEMDNTLLSSYVKSSVSGSLSCKFLL